jgi:CBS domain-containing protein
MIFVQELLDQKGHETWSIHPRAQAYEALQVLANKNIGALLVVENERLVGIFSERDYARKVILQGKSSKETPVKALMTEHVVTVYPENLLESCLRLMTDHRIRHLPVLNDNKIVGILTIGDVVKHIISQQQSTIQHLEDYIMAR